MMIVLKIKDDAPAGWMAVPDGMDARAFVVSNGLPDDVAQRINDAPNSPTIQDLGGGYWLLSAQVITDETTLAGMMAKARRQADASLAAVDHALDNPPSWAVGATGGLPGATLRAAVGGDHLGSVVSLHLQGWRE